MTKKWTYVMAALLLGMIAVIVVAAVHIPAQERQLASERQAHGQMVEVAWRVMPATIADAAAEAAFIEVDRLPVSIDGKTTAALSALRYTMVSDEAALNQARQAILDGLSGVEDNYGYVTNDGGEYLVGAMIINGQLQVTIYQVK